MTTDVGAGGRDSLTAKEEALFDLLDRHPGRLFSRTEILERVWGLEFGGDDRIVDAYVKRIRRKTGEDLIETVRGAGYRRPSSAPQQALPHYHHLSSDARIILDLGRRILRVNTAAGVLQEVDGALQSVVRLRGVALLTRPEGGDFDPQVPWLVRAAAGQTAVAWFDLPPLSGSLPLYQAAWGPHKLAIALLPLAGADRPWGTLAVVAPPGERWDAAMYAQLEAVAALVNPALRLNMEFDLRRNAEQELRALNAGLEARVQQRTEALLRAIQQAELLNALSRQLERARSAPEVLAEALPVLAQLAGRGACAAWFPAPGGEPLACYGADGARVAGPRLDGAAQSQFVRCEVGGEELVVYPFDPSQAAPGGLEPGPLLQTAAQSLALNLSRLLHMQVMERTALTDEYTGLGNRQAFLYDLTAEVAYSARHGSGLLLSMVELANIRFLNATVGYAGGNDLIRLLAQSLGRAGRTEDRAYRLNGATFAVLLRIPPGQDRLSAAQGWRERLHEVLGGFSRGVALRADLLLSHVLCPEEGGSPSDLLRAALDGLNPVAPPSDGDRR